MHEYEFSTGNVKVCNGKYGFIKKNSDSIILLEINIKSVNIKPV